MKSYKLQHFQSHNNVFSYLHFYTKNRKRTRFFRLIFEHRQTVRTHTHIRIQEVMVIYSGFAPRRALNIGLTENAFCLLTTFRVYLRKFTLTLFATVRLVFYFRSIMFSYKRMKETKKKCLLFFSQHTYTRTVNKYNT